MHRPPAADLVHALKYDGWWELAPYMADSMTACVTLDFSELEAALIVPIPTTQRNLHRRSYNQAALLAEHLARAWGRPLGHLLRRVGVSPSQTTLSPGRRLTNVRGAFGPASPGPERALGRDLVLVDDVLTTGATAGEAARTLAGMGARSVSVVTFARALSD